MSVQPKDLLALHAPTPPDAVKQRQGNKQHQGECQKQYGVCQLQHRMLDYVDARHVEQFLDDVIGPANWQRRHVIGEGGKVACDIGIRVRHDDGVTEWVWKGDGAGDTDIEGEKGSFSDSFKRAGVSWGIARDLYGNTQGGQRNSSPARPPAPAPVGHPAGAEPPWAAPEPVRGSSFAPTTGTSPNDVCPDHRLGWVLQPGGTSKNGKAYGAFWKCPHKGPPFCNEKPSAEWQARHETAA